MAGDDGRKQGRVAIPQEALERLVEQVNTISDLYKSLIKIAHRQTDQIEQLRDALDGLLEYAAQTKEARDWNSATTPEAVVTAELTLLRTKPD